MLADQDIVATLSDDALKKLARDGYTFELGARPLQRIIEREIINKLSIKIITGDIKAGDHVFINIKDDTYQFTKKK